MSHAPPLLLVDNNRHEARSITAALSRYGLPPPTHVRTGEQALAWCAFHPCTACVIATDLPGLSGVETMVRLRERQPALPVVVISHAHRETMAMAALGAGAAAYISTSPSLPEDVAAAVARCGATNSHGNDARRYDSITLTSTSV